MKKILIFCLFFFLVLVFTFSLVVALPPPPPPTPSIPEGSSEESGSGSDIQSEGVIPTEEVFPDETAGQEAQESSLESRVAVLEQRMEVLENQGLSTGVLFLIAVNIVALGLIIYFLFRKKSPP